jgi:hypothetical protein
MPDDLIDRIVAVATREHVTRAWITGAPTGIAAQIKPYLVGGIDGVMPID